MYLSELKTGDTAVVVRVSGHGGFRRRIQEMGFVRGQEVKSVLNAPLNDPIKYSIMGYEVSLRRSEAQMVEVITLDEAAQIESATSTSTSAFGSAHEVIQSKCREINVALIGNPNSGKTSLFNVLSGGHAHVGNYSGVTVGATKGSLTHNGYKINLTDLPGTYALSAYTPEELFVRQHLIVARPDVIINAVVASNLERNLYLTTELIDLNPKMVVALNMYDELEASGAQLDHDCLGRMIGVPMIPVAAHAKRGIDELLDEVISVYENSNPKVRHIHINYSPSVESEIKLIKQLIKQHADELPQCFPPRYWAIKLLEQDDSAARILASSPHYKEWAEAAAKSAEHIQQDLHEDVESAITNEKYGFIEGALTETYTEGRHELHRRSSLIDRIVTNKFFGFPLFLLLMFVMFWTTFTLGQYPQEWISSGVGALGEWVASLLSDGALKSLLVDGIIGGVGSVIVFLPNILLLYLFISVMEDSGYMARAAFIMDKLMHRIGLHGKSFIPLVMGFGCNVPAIMATRAIESRSSRIITILINPFMSCSARLPVYILFAGAFFPEHAGVVLFGMYVLGGVVAVVTARVLRRFMFGADETPFVMELPPYRIPTAQATVRHMWEKGAQYLQKIGSTIMVAAIIIWFLSYFPHATVAPSDIPQGETAAYVSTEHSYLGQIGKVCEPVLAPLGLGWQTSIALLSGAAAKEIIISTLGVLYASGSEEHSTLTAALSASGDFTTASALAFMVFVLLYMPCIASVAAIAREAGSWRWAAFSVVYSISIAWLLALCAYHAVLLFS